jgi:hypothetical protein
VDQHSPTRTHGDLISELRRQKSKRQQSRRPKPVTTTSSSADKPGEYHHVPREAARQFARTTTVDNMAFRKPSKRTLKPQAEGDRAPAREPATSEPARAERPSQSERPHFQRTRIMEDVAAADMAAERGLRRASVADMYSLAEEHLSHMVHNQHQARRQSLVQMEPIVDLVEDPLTPPPDDQLEQRDPRNNVRVDWTQSDEIRGKSLFSPLLRKADSMWTLRKGRLANKTTSSSLSESSSTSDKEESLAIPIPEGGKSPRAGFFAKFKR